MYKIKEDNNIDIWVTNEGQFLAFSSHLEEDDYVPENAIFRARTISELEDLISEFKGEKIEALLLNRFLFANGEIVKKEFTKIGNYYFDKKTSSYSDLYDPDILLSAHFEKILEIHRARERCNNIIANNEALIIKYTAEISEIFKSEKEFFDIFKLK